MAVKDINSLSPKYRDILLNQNIGKYAAITMPLIDPIGKSIDIYNSTPTLKKSITNGDLLTYTNNNIKNDYYTQYRNLDSTIVDYIDSKSKYTKDYSYVDEISKGLVDQATNTILSYLMGGEVNVGINGGNQFQINSSFDYGNTVEGLALNVVAGKESKLGEIGLRSLGLQLANSVLDKTRRSEAMIKFLEKPLEYFDAIDKLDTEKLNFSPGLSNFIGGTFPIYLYSEVKKSSGDSFNPLKNNTLSWGNLSDKFIDNNSGEYNQSTVVLDKQSLLYKTQQMFKSGKIHTLTSDLDNSRLDSKVDGLVTKGRPLLMRDKNGNPIQGSYKRAWTASKQYRNVKDLIRPLNGDSSSGGSMKDVLKNDLKRVRPGAKALETYGVLQEDGFVKISPYSNFKSKTDVHKYMFSIENLAWKRKDGFLDSLIQGSSQDGPNGGRIMWFPPYDIKFTDNTNVNWNTDNFIGRGEPVYTYVNTERSGSLNFKVIVDHPSILNYYKQKDPSGEVIKDDDYHRLFAGMDVLDLESTTQIDKITKKPVVPVTTEKPNVYTFKVYFPNYLSGVDYLNYPDVIMEYLYHGAYCEPDFYGGQGYEMTANSGLTLNTGLTCCQSYALAQTEINLSQKTISLNLIEDINIEMDSYLNDIELYNGTQISGSTYAISRNNNILTIGINNCIPFNIDEYFLGNVINHTRIINELIRRLKTFEQKLGSQLEPIDGVNELRTPITTSPCYLYQIDLTYNYEQLQTLLGQINAIPTNVDPSGSDCNQYYIFDDTYAESVKNLKPIENQMDTTSTGLNSSEGNFDFSFKDVYEFLNYGTDVKDIKNIFSKIKKIEISGSASHQGPDSVNKTLAINRAETIKGWIINNINQGTFINLDKNLITTNSIYQTGGDNQKGLTNNPTVKAERCVYIRMTDSSETSFLAPEGTQYDITGTTQEFSTLATRPKVDMYGYSATNPMDGSNSNLYNDEAQFFDQIGKDKDFIYEKFFEKIKYFHPAFHSTTPEGFNSRLTFLHQCTRQGNTENNAGLATNLAFGRPPICVLRIGDFYNTKIIFDNLNIDFEPLVWDMNPEGIGVQPMLANVNMSFKFIGGSDLTGPIARLQNAITFNFFANTGVYDDRNDRFTTYEVTGKKKMNEDRSFTNEYYPMYNPGVYDSQPITKSEQTSNSSTKSQPQKPYVSQKGFIYNIKQSGSIKWVEITKQDGTFVKNGPQSNTMTSDQLLMQARIDMIDSI